AARNRNAKNRVEVCRPCYGVRQLRYFFGDMLQIVVKRDQYLPGRLSDTIECGVSLTDILQELHGNDAKIGVGDFIQRDEASIRATIVDEYQFESFPQRFHDCGQSSVELAHQRSRVEDWNDD